jgi:hypothetical protein
LRGRQRRSIADHEPDFGLIVEFQVTLRAAYMQRNQRPDGPTETWSRWPSRH